MAYKSTILNLNEGGTNANLTASNGGIFYSTASAVAVLAGTATAGQILRSGASTTPSWSTATYPATAGTAGNFLTSDGTNFVSSGAASGGASLVLIQSLSATNSATLSFTSGITSTYQNYFLTLTNLIPATGGAAIVVTLSIDGGSSYLSTGYQRGRWDYLFNSATIANSNSTANLLACTSCDNTAAVGTSAQFYLFGLPSTNYKYANGQGTTITSANTDYFFTAGSQSTASAVNAIRVAFSSGNITSGTATLYGIRSS